MIKRRVSDAPISEDDFINGIDKANEPKENSDTLNPKAPRKFKSHTLPLNEYEYKACG